MRGRAIVYILAAFFFLGTHAHAQEWPSAAQIVQKVRTDLDLDQEQFDAVKLIIERNMAKRKQIWARSSRGPTLAQSEELQADLYGRLRGVLTRYQMGQWNKILKIIEQDVAAASAANSHSQPLPVN